MLSHARAFSVATGPWSETQPVNKLQTRHLAWGNMLSETNNDHAFHLNNTVDKKSDVMYWCKQTETYNLACVATNLLRNTLAQGQLGPNGYK
eukprot:775713-Amphidinium_carterae.1